MEDLVSCEKCKREWDGFAQCPCGIGDYDSESDNEGNIEDIQKIIMNLQRKMVL